MRLRQASAQVTADLQRHGTPDSQLEAEVIIRHALHYDRARFYASFAERLNSKDLLRIQGFVSRRIAGEPLPYITGHREFYGLDFIVNPAVLIPRQETELLVDAALDFARNHQQEDIAIADIGTGSGAIAVAIASNLPAAQAHAIDCSADALSVTDRNRRKHGVADRVSLLQGDLLAPLKHSVDLIVSNPPYINSKLLPDLPEEVRREPRLALDGGEQGLDVIRRLITQASSKLTAGGRLIIEISPEQLDSVCQMARERFPRGAVTNCKDLLGSARCVVVDTH